MPPDTLEDRDLRLCPMTDAHLPEVSRQLNDARISRWMAAVAQPFDAAAGRALLAHGQHPGEDLRVVEHAGKVVGGLCIGASLWYWLAPEAWGQGLMRRALGLVLPAHFAGNVPPLVATCHQDNAASRGLLTDLGFALCPARRRMFVQATERSEPCRDFLMAPELWHLLHPPRIDLGPPTSPLTLTPAKPGDAPDVARLAAHLRDRPWPQEDDPGDFIEAHRFRGGACGLFLIRDAHRCCIGMALLTDEGLHLTFRSAGDAAQHRSAVIAGLSAEFPGSPPEVIPEAPQATN